MKTKLTFLLSLTFLFLFSGSVYGGVIDETIDDVFDRKDGVVVLSCLWKSIWKSDVGDGYDNKTRYYFSINMKDKVIKEWERKGLSGTYKVDMENEFSIQGVSNEGGVKLFISKHSYDKYILILKDIIFDDILLNTTYEYKCSIGDKVF